MKVILTQPVKTLGNIGEIVNVSIGYARNYLIPGQFAVLADDKNKQKLENEKKKLSKKVNAAKADAQAKKAKIDGIQLSFTKRVGANGKLFGNISANDISKELEAQEVIVERRQIVIPNPIKSTGNFDVKVKLFEGVEAAFKVKVEMDHNQIEELKKAQAKAELKKKNAPAEEAAAETTEVSTEATNEEA